MPRRIVTAREQVEMLSPWLREAADDFDEEKFWREHEQTLKLMQDKANGLKYVTLQPGLTMAVGLDWNGFVPPKTHPNHIVPHLAPNDIHGYLQHEDDGHVNFIHTNPQLQRNGIGKKLIDHAGITDTAYADRFTSQGQQFSDKYRARTAARTTMLPIEVAKHYSTFNPYEPEDDEPEGQRADRMRAYEDTLKNEGWEGFGKGNSVSYPVLSVGSSGRHAVLNGHHRVWAADKLGLTHIPVEFIHGEDDDWAKQYGRPVEPYVAGLLGGTSRTAAADYHIEETVPGKHWRAYVPGTQDPRGWKYTPSVGQLKVDHHEGQPYLSWVSVNPDHQRQGLAQTMWEKAGRPLHVPGTQTDEGKAWADKVGGDNLWWSGNEHLREARTAMSDIYDEYAGHHQAPGPGTGFPIHQMSGNDDLGGVDETWLTHPQYYTHGEVSNPEMRRVQNLYKQVQGNPEAPVDIYRALPPGNDTINTGDWVTPSLEYARQHAMHATDPSQDWPVIKNTVPAKHLWQNADSYYEFGYHGPGGKAKKANTMVPVTLYAKPQCPQCDMTHKRLNAHGIPHQVVDLTTDPEAYAHVTQNLGYQQAPVVVAGDDHWSGFRPDRIKALLG